LNLELGDKYRVTVSVPTKKADIITPSNDEDLKEIDNEINAVTSEDFSEKGLNNQAVGL
jgi:hypothetical protein